MGDQMAASYHTLAPAQLNALANPPIESMKMVIAACVHTYKNPQLNVLEIPPNPPNELTKMSVVARRHHAHATARRNALANPPIDSTEMAIYRGSYRQCHG